MIFVSTFWDEQEVTLRRLGGQPVPLHARPRAAGGGPGAYAYTPSAGGGRPSSPGVGTLAGRARPRSSRSSARSAGRSSQRAYAGQGPIRIRRRAAPRGAARRRRRRSCPPSTARAPILLRSRERDGPRRLAPRAPSFLDPDLLRKLGARLDGVARRRWFPRRRRRGAARVPGRVGARVSRLRASRTDPVVIGYHDSRRRSSPRSGAPATRPTGGAGCETGSRRLRLELPGGAFTLDGNRQAVRDGYPSTIVVRRAASPSLPPVAAVPGRRADVRRSPLARHHRPAPSQPCRRAPPPCGLADQPAIVQVKRVSLATGCEPAGRSPRRTRIVGAVGRVASACGRGRGHRGASDPSGRRRRCPPAPRRREHPGRDRLARVRRRRRARVARRSTRSRVTGSHRGHPRPSWRRAANVTPELRASHAPSSTAAQSCSAPANGTRTGPSPRRAPTTTPTSHGALSSSARTRASSSSRRVRRPAAGRRPARRRAARDRRRGVDVKAAVRASTPSAMSRSRCCREQREASAELVAAVAAVDVNSSSRGGSRASGAASATSASSRSSASAVTRRERSAGERLAPRTWKQRAPDPAENRRARSSRSHGLGSIPSSPTASPAQRGRSRAPPPVVLSDRAPHQQPVGPLAQRMLRDQRLELGDELGMPTAREIGLDPALEREEAQLLEARGDRRDAGSSARSASAGPRQRQAPRRGVGGPCGSSRSSARAPSWRVARTGQVERPG